MTVQIIVDCDRGVDDAIALLLALSSSKLKILGITTVAGNVPVEATARNAQQILDLAGVTDIPVHPGCTRPLVGPPMHGIYHGTSGLGPLVLPPPSRPLSPIHAVTFLATQLEAAMGRGEALTLCTLGPLTNIAMLLRLHPHLQPGIARIVSMGGAYREAGNRTITSEFNVLADPHAAHIVFSSVLPITSIPLDATHQVMATPERVAALDLPPGPVGTALATLLAHWDRNDPTRYGSRGGPMHDPLVPAFLVDATLFQTERARVFVEHTSPLAMGQTIADWHDKSGEPANVDVVTKADAEGFFRMLGTQLASFGLPPP